MSLSFSLSLSLTHRKQDGRIPRISDRVEPSPAYFGPPSSPLSIPKVKEKEKSTANFIFVCFRELSQCCL